MLVGDDYEDSVVSLALVLESLGYEVKTATDGRAAFELAMDYQPDVVLLDIGMPTMNGYEICRGIRTDEAWGKSALIVALTGRGREDDKRRSREAGFDLHVVKPIDPNSLMGLLREARRDKS